MSAAHPPSPGRLSARSGESALDPRLGEQHEHKYVCVRMPALDIPGTTSSITWDILKAWSPDPITGEDDLNEAIGIFKGKAP